MMRKPARHITIEKIMEMVLFDFSVILIMHPFRIHRTYL